MIEVKVERELDAPMGRVWALLEDFGNLDWYPGWTRIEVLGSGIGMTRRIHMPDMEPIDETLEAMDSAQHHFRYTIPNMPMPVKDYHADVQLRAAADDRTLVIWRCEMVPEGIPAEDASAMLEGVYADMLDKLEIAAKA